jgi:hypothetical protein
MAKSRRYRRKRRSRTRRRKQKTIMMIGCSICGPNCKCGPKCNCSHPCPGNCYKKHKGGSGSGCGPNGCPIAPMSYSQMNKYGGGNIPGPFVGKSWSPNTNDWPGTNGVGSDNNYLSPYDVSKNPQLQMKMEGGGFIPQDLVNLGRDFTYNLKSTYNTLNGYDAPINPLPYKHQAYSISNRLLL